MEPDPRTRRLAALPGVAGRVRTRRSARSLPEHVFQPETPERLLPQPRDEAAGIMARSGWRSAVTRAGRSRRSKGAWTRGASRS
ncbi:hypothetical protein VP06_13155 [Methylobacterium aquaticum]|uniref:Uncharacterized protein n=1 Tax=Methylobacterium aquaticum TaxID=270351 RepID=A0A0J6SML2_9HYPH|nr:hypothetical protein VP06_13155 [Methylobacterium aquaticum]